MAKTWLAKSAAQGYERASVFHDGFDATIAATISAHGDDYTKWKFV